MSNRKVMALIVVAALLLLVANLSIWIWSSIIDEDGFTEIAYSATTEEEVRHAIATIIINDLMESIPIARTLFGDQIISTLSDILSTEPFSLTFDRIVSTTHRILVSGSSEAVVIDTSSISRIVNVLNLALWTSTTGESSRQFPSEIVLVEARTFPGIKRIVDVTPWAAVIAVAGTLVTAGAAILLAANRRLALIATGLATLGVAALTLALVIPLRAMVLNDVIIREQRTIVGAVYDGLLVSLRTQTLVLAGFGAILIVATLIFSLLRRPLRPSSSQ